MLDISKPWIRCRNNRRNHVKPANRMIWLGIGLGALFWVLESIIHARVSHEGNAITHMLNPDISEIWLVPLVVFIFIIFGRYADITLAKSKQAEEALRVANDRISTVLQTSMDAFWVMDTSGNFRDINDAFSEIIGCSREELLRMNIKDLEAAETAENTTRHIEEVMSKGRDRFETKHRRKDGRIIDMEISTTFVELSGDPMLVVFGRDITERKQTEEALERSEERYRTMIEHSNELIWILDREGNFTYFNKRAEEISGYRLAELLGKSFAPMILSADSPRVKEIFLETLSGKSQKYEVNVLREDGSTFVLSVNTAPIFESGEIVGTVSFGRDITERKRAENLLAVEKDRLDVTLRSIGDGVISTDTKGKIVLINQVAEDLTGWTQEEAIAKPLNRIFHIINEKTREHCENPVEKVLKSGGIVGLANHTALIARDGTVRSIFDSGAPIRDKDGNTIGVVLVFRDVTEHRRAEEQIRYLSFHDKLTGLYNRAYFEEELSRLDTERQLPLSLIIGDINGLKLFNDAFGHQKGDELLTGIAQILKTSCRKEDIIARWGGDEFAILLPGTTQEVAMRVSERIRKACGEASGYPVQPSIALGVATKEKPDQDIQEVLREAEDWMYRKKLMESRSAHSSIISSLQKTLGERTHETEEHAQRLQNLALRMGHNLGLSDSQLDELTLLALLHDMGKVAIPDNILTKPDRLSTEDWKAMQKHPEIGYRIAASSHELAHIAEAILAHHERWDGAGYPHGLKSDEIPLISRILTIIDSYDVMTHRRPYKEAISHQEALEELKRCAGSQFDPKLVEIFIEIVSSLEMEAEAATTEQNDRQEESK